MPLATIAVISWLQFFYCRYMCVCVFVCLLLFHIVREENNLVFEPNHLIKLNLLYALRKMVAAFATLRMAGSPAQQNHILFCSCGDALLSFYYLSIQPSIHTSPRWLWLQSERSPIIIMDAFRSVLRNGNDGTGQNGTFYIPDKAGMDDAIWSYIRLM